jgi:hypothetical protein
VEATAEIAEDHQVVAVLVLASFGEIRGAGEDGRVLPVEVDDDELVVDHYPRPIPMDSSTSKQRRATPSPRWTVKFSGRPAIATKLLRKCLICNELVCLKRKSLRNLDCPPRIGRVFAHIAGIPVEETALSLAPVGATLIGVAGLRLKEVWRRSHPSGAPKGPSTSTGRGPRR